MATPNALFAVFSTSNRSAIEAKLAAATGWLYLSVPGDSWLVVTPSATTSKEVCEKIGIVDGESSGIVVRFESYFGRIAPSVWEWIRAKQGAELGVTTTSTI